VGRSLFVFFSSGLTRDCLFLFPGSYTTLMFSFRVSGMWRTPARRRHTTWSSSSSTATSTTRSPGPFRRGRSYGCGSAGITQLCWASAWVTTCVAEANDQIDDIFVYFHVLEHLNVSKGKTETFKCYKGPSSFVNHLFLAIIRTIYDFLLYNTVHIKLQKV